MYNQEDTVREDQLHLDNDRGGGQSLPTWRVFVISVWKTKTQNISDFMGYRKYLVVRY